MAKTAAKLGGTFTFPGTNLTVNRMGYGAMQLAGPGVFGPPKDMDQAVAVLREAIESGVNHIDTSDYYGPHITNQIIKKALHPYPNDLVIVSKLGARRGDDASWIKAHDKDSLISGLHDNLRNLAVEAIDIVNLRVGDMLAPNENSIEEELSALVDLKKQGLVKHIGLSNISTKQFEQAIKVTEIVCVQNMFNIANRSDDKLIEMLATKKVAYVPFFPLGGFEPLQSEKLDELAKKANVTTMQLALAWLIKHSSNILLIPGTGSLGHLRENIQAASLEISDEMMTELDAIGKKS
jgi:pyridoxine 4-dehydrogenase